MLNAKESKVCVVGAGMSGLTAMKALIDQGIDFEAFERRSDVGGLWRYSSNPDEFSVYDCCYTISCKHWTGYVDFPMPDAYPEYLHHTKMLEYFRNYAQAHRLLRHITFGVSVENIARHGDDWHVRLSNGEIRHYSHVIVATGQFGYPVTPHYPGTFHGKSCHSGAYKRAEDFTGLRTLVVGLGNSGCDIAADISRVASRTYLSTRESAHVIPKYVFGLPFLHFGYALRLPIVLLQVMLQIVAWLGRGSLSGYRFPAPTRRPLLKNPTISSQLLDRVGHGAIIMKPAVERFTTGGAVLADGTELELDAVVFCTGFEIRFPFFDESMISYRREKFRNYGLMVNLDHPNLFFIGLFNPLGTYAPIAERQARWAARLISGALRLPSRAKMERWYERHQRKMSRRFNDYENPLINVDFFAFARELDGWLK